MMRGVYPLLKHQRDCGSERQDEDERAFELAQQQPNRAHAGRVFDTVGADEGKLRCGSIGRKTAGPGAEGRR